MKKKNLKKKNKKSELLLEQDEFYDGDFVFIAGYTSGGAPYGIRWEDVGIDPDLSLEQKYSLYYEEKELKESEIEEDELPF